MAELRVTGLNGATNSCGSLNPALIGRMSSTKILNLRQNLTFVVKKRFSPIIISVIPIMVRISGV